MLNLLVLPGLGTLLAGRRRNGLLQATLAIIGFGFGVAWMIWFFRELLGSEQLPEDLTAHIWVVLSGAGLFLLAWLWALVDSLQIVRAARLQPQRDEMK